MQWREVTMEKENWEEHSGSLTAYDSHGEEWNCLENVTRIYEEVKELILTVQYLRWMSGDAFSIRDGILS